MTYSRWVGATWLGWLGGIPLVAAFALLGEALGIGGAQVLIGAGMGTAVGLAQGHALRTTLGRMAPWVWSCAAGLAPPFLLADMLRATGHDNRYAVDVAVALGGITAGVWQAYLLRTRATHAAWWVLASAVGWTLAALSAAWADALLRAHAIRGATGAAIYLGLTAAGGLLLGAATGLALVRLLQRSSPAVTERLPRPGR